MNQTLLAILQWIDVIFQKAIALPLVFELLYHFRVFKKDKRLIKFFHKLFVVLIVIFLIRCFLAQFIFTPVNYHRFVDTGYFPLIRAIFYN